MLTAKEARLKLLENILSTTENGNMIEHLSAIIESTIQEKGHSMNLDVTNIPVGDRTLIKEYLELKEYKVAGFPDTITKEDKKRYLSTISDFQYFKIRW